MLRILTNSTTLSTKKKKMKNEESLRELSVPRLHYYNKGEVVMFSTTRHGGVSSGEYASFNINEYCGDTAENIAAHYATNLE